MSEERAIRINKVLRELNISLERAVDYLKENNHNIDASPNAKISDVEYDILCGQFSSDKGKKVASIEVGEEKRKEKEALKKELEKELEVKRLLEEKQKLEVIKAKASISGPKTIGKIDLDYKKPVKDQEIAKAESPKAESPKEEVPKVETPKAETPKVEVPKNIVVEINEVVRPVSEKPKLEKKSIILEKSGSIIKENTPKEDLVKPVTETEEEEEEKVETQYTKLAVANFTGKTIDLSQFNKPKKKDPKKEVKKAGDVKPAGAVGANNNANKNKRRRIAKPGAPNPGPVRTGVGAPGGKKEFVRGAFNKPGVKKALIQKVEPTEEDVKNQIKETLERLQGRGKGGKSKAAKYRRDKRDSHRQRSEDEQQAIEQGSKTIKVTEFVTVGEVATMMDVPVTKVIGTCMTLGIMVTQNQRLDAETLTIVADEFGYEVEFISSEIEENLEIVQD
jgi:translation initiation factor IF-2